MTQKERWTRPNWMSILAAGVTPVLKFGSAGAEVRRVQRALNAVSDEPRLKITGVFGKSTDAALRAYQRRIGEKVSGVVVGDTLRGLRFGER